MAFFPRKTQGGRPAGDDIVEPLEFERRPQTIGEELSEARERHGASLEDVGAALRIRPAFLKAIEENQYGRLPGPVYALGFVRTYADYLGLDGEAFARRFKSEVAGLDSKRDFSFPMPLPERGGFPGLAVLLVAVIIGACAYAVWYYRASGERVRPERVAAVPEQLIPLPPPSPLAAPSGGDGAPQGVAAIPVPATPALPAALPPAPPPASPAPAAAPAAPTPTVAAAAPPGPSVEVGTPPPVPPSPPPAAPAVVPAPAAASPPRPPVETARAPAIPEVPAASATPEAPRVYGITNGPVRVVIKASADSWVQVRDANAVSIQTRTLRPGESLRVPDLPGLTVRTGNAGALQISVDGRPVPPIGPLGKARSASLDPDRLVAGSATLE